MPAGPEVMLASAAGMDAGTAIEAYTRQGWTFEVKWDGIRAVITRDAGGVTITNRRRADITARYPEVAAAWETLAPIGSVIDGEIIVAGPDGRPDFPAAHRRDAQSSLAAIRHLSVASPATFMAFDLLEAAGRDVRTWKQRERRSELTGFLEGSGYRVPVSSPEGAVMWDFVSGRDLEGLVAKAPEASYRAGRSPSWRKIKCLKRICALVGGVRPGTGSRGAIGALELFLWDSDAGALAFIGKVGSGMSQADLSALESRLSRGTPTVVEVEYMEVSPTGQLRQPVFKGIRPGADPAGCLISGLRHS